MTREKALYIVKQYFKSLPKPHYGWFEGQQAKFFLESTARWAVSEIHRYILENHDWDPIDSVDDFAIIMDECACVSDLPEINNAFSIAHDIAQDILGYLLAEQERERLGCKDTGCIELETQEKMIANRTAELLYRQKKGDKRM